MRRGVCYFLVLCILFLVSVPVQGIPPHENFGDTSPDLLAVIASLSDVKLLCEESLQLSSDARGNLTLNKPLVMVFSNETLTSSLRTSHELRENLSSFSAYLGTLQNHAESYSYLRDLFVPLQALGLNVTSFVEGHRAILENLTTSVTLINQGGDATEAVVALGNIRSTVMNGRVCLQNIERYTGVISSNYSVDVLQSLVSSLYPLLETYDSYSTSLLELCNGVNPYLVLNGNTTAESLGGTVHVYGCFIAQRQFVSNQRIDIQMENHPQITTMTDARGSYTMAIPISRAHPLGTFSILATTTYHNTLCHSNTVFVTVQRIPTNLTFFTDATHVYVNESFRSFGRLVDDRNNGIQTTITLHLAGYNSSVETDEAGNFSTVFNETLPFGAYPMFISFISDAIYAPCESRRITIYVNTPTSLTLFASTIGDTIRCTGQLTSLIDSSPVQQKRIDVMINKKQLGSGTTNTNGWYTINVPTRTLRAGASVVSARFTADEPQWRNATSNEVELQIVMGSPYWDALLIGGTLAALVPVFLFFRRRIITLGNKHPLRTRSFTPKGSPSPLPSKSLPAVQDELLQNISSNTDGDIREAIIQRYHLLIRLLSSRGLIFSPSSTHLDIKNMLIQKGLSKNATETITDLFERAQYSPYPLGTKEAVMFNTNLQELMTTLGGYSWIRQ